MTANLEASGNELSVDIVDYVATVEIHRPPHNFFDYDLIKAIADTYESLDRDDNVRAIVLCSEGKNFCAGADFSSRDTWSNNQITSTAGQLYVEAARVFSTTKPVVAAVQGAAVGGGLGLAMSTDFRVTCAEGRFSANFARLGFHQGFGLSTTLPRIVGRQKASWMLMSGCRIKGEEAVAIGLADELTSLDNVRVRAQEMATEIALSAPLAVESIRATLRAGLADEIRAMTDHELAEQDRLRATEDFKEGLKAVSERRPAAFTRT